jgi:peptidoglycan hydrolase CwlO-like protein
LRSEIQSLQENSNEHISSQKVHCQELQTKLIHLEDRIECSNLEIMEITSERDKTDKERIKFRKLYDDLKGKERELADEAEKNVLNLKNQIVKLEVKHR